MQKRVNLKNGDTAIIDTLNEDVKTLRPEYVMAAINGGKFQPLHKSKIKDDAKF